MFPKSAAVQQQQQGQRAARTFEELAQRQPGRQVLGDLLPGSDYLPPALPALADASNLAAAAAAGGSGDRQLAPADTPPLDWSLKTTVRFSSPSPFAVAEEAALLSAGEALAAQRAAAACDAGTHGLSMQQRFLAALHSWQFPHDPWRQPAPQQRGGALPPEAAQRRLDWQAAFASLYDALRCGACDAFYYLSPEVRHLGARGGGGLRGWACSAWCAGAAGGDWPGGAAAASALGACPAEAPTPALPCPGHQEAVRGAVWGGGRGRPPAHPRAAHPLHRGPAGAAERRPRAGLCGTAAAG